jgi:ABC-type polysaccharide/polyol phosphate transport system ATPase subunit
MSDITKQQAVQMTNNKPQSTIDNQNSQDLQSQIRNPQSPILNPDIAISVRSLSKKYQLYETPKHRLKEALHPFKKKYHREFWAVRDVSFEVGRGETFGIIGRNGSGKSTLLQMICGILTPTRGNVHISGSVAALLELGAGFNLEFTGKENVYINGAITGFSRQEIDARFDDIAAFADIGKFIDQPVKTYSSGMYVRLAFAVAINVDPNILVVDEALSVGDVFFQQKCYAQIRKIQASGTTCLFVSHDTATVQHLCDRVLFLEHGKTMFLGDPEEAVSRYFSSIGKRAAPKPKAAEKVEPEAVSRSDGDMMTPEEIMAHNILDQAKSRHGTGGVEVVGLTVTDKTGRHTLQVEMMETLTFHLLLRAKQQIIKPTSGIHLYDRLGNLVFAAGSSNLLHRLPSLSIGQELVVKFVLVLSVQSGEYVFSVGCSEPAAEEQGPNVGFLHDRHEALGPIVVTADGSKLLPFYGIAQLPMSIAYRSTN